MGCRRRGLVTCRRPVVARRADLVPDDTIELEIVTSRLALAIMDRASWEFADLRSRVAHLEGRSELDPTTCCAPTCWRASCSTPGALPACRWKAGANCSPRCTTSCAGGGRGLPRDQPLAGQPGRAARGGLAALHPPFTHPPQRPLGWQAGTGRPRRHSGQSGQSGYGNQNGPGLFRAVAHYGPASGFLRWLVRRRPQWPWTVWAKRRA
jgi:hypothetical protein